MRYFIALEVAAGSKLFVVMKAEMLPEMIVGEIRFERLF